MAKVRAEGVAAGHIAHHGDGAVAIDRADVRVRYGRGVAHLRMGGNEEAIEDFSAILDIDPDNIGALVHLLR